MIDDIVYDVSDFILELPSGTPGGDIVSFSMDGFSYDFISSTGESSCVFVN
jgi:hypothetical protein